MAANQDLTPAHPSPTMIPMIPMTDIPDWCEVHGADRIHPDVEVCRNHLNSDARCDFTATETSSHTWQPDDPRLPSSPWIEGDLVSRLIDAAETLAPDSCEPDSDADLLLRAASMIQYLERRCEVYAAGVTAIANPLPGNTLGVLQRTATRTLRSVESLTS